MKTEDATRSLAADYDDAPARRSGHPLVRVLRACGALLTVFVAATIGALVLLRIEIPVLVFLGGGLISIVSLPLIVVFWTKEVRWRRGRLSDSTLIIAVSVLTWIAEVLFSGIMLILSRYLLE